MCHIKIPITDYVHNFIWFKRIARRQKAIDLKVVFMVFMVFMFLMKLISLNLSSEGDISEKYLSVSSDIPQL